MNKDQYDFAHKMLTLGYPVIPCGGGESGKASLVHWKEWQGKKPDDGQLEEWYHKLNPTHWAVVTNADLGVVDADTPEARANLEQSLGAPHFTTPRGGAHWYVDTRGHPLRTDTRVMEGVDTRGQGGYAIFNGRGYTCHNLPIPGQIPTFDMLPPAIKDRSNGQKPRGEAVPESETIPQGRRNATLIKIAGGMRKQGLTIEAIDEALQAINLKSCDPPLGKDEVAAIAESSRRWPAEGTGIYRVINYSPKDTDPDSERYKSVTKSVTNGVENGVSVTTSTLREFVVDSGGRWFSYDDVDKEFNIRSEAGKRNRRIIFKRFRDEGLVEHHPTNNKLLRYRNVTVRIIDFRSAGSRTPLQLRYPFGIEEYFNTYPGNIIALAGAADAGKTAFLLNFVRLNMADYAIYYQSSEMGAAELASRLEKFLDLDLADWNFTPEERSRDYADVIRPDCVNIVDFLEFTGDFYAVADYMRQIHERLAGGIAIIAMQKKRGAELGRGGDFGLEKPRLYLTMDKGLLTIQKCKNWTDPEVNPNGLKMKFKILRGAEFVPQGLWYRENKE